MQHHGALAKASKSRLQSRSMSGEPSPSRTLPLRWPALLVLALTPVVFLLAVQPALRWAMAEDAAQWAQLWEEGKSWSLAEPDSLAGEAPWGTSPWRRDGDGLTLTEASPSDFLSLNFSGNRLPAAHLARLEIHIDAERAGELHLYHRATLEGTIAKAPPVRVAQGVQTLSVALAELAWREATGDLTTWGLGTGGVASLRIHPAATGGRTPTRVTIRDIRILPTASPKPRPNRAVSSLQAARQATVAAEVTITSQLLQPGLVRHAQAMLAQNAPGASLSAGSPPVPPPPDWSPLLVAALGALAGVALRRHRQAIALVTLALCAGLTLSSPTWSLLSVMGLTLALLNAVLLGHQGGYRISGDALAWRELVWVAAPLTGIWGGLIVLGGELPDGDHLRRWPLYLAWAGVQQWLLCTVFLNLARDTGRPVALPIAALLFGWVHLPNFELMLLTWLLALIVLWHFERHRALLPVAVLHGIAGPAFLATLPSWLVYSGQVGANFW